MKDIAERVAANRLERAFVASECELTSNLAQGISRGSILDGVFGAMFTHGTSEFGQNSEHLRGD